MNLGQYIVRHPVSLQKILYARSNGNNIYKTKYNVYCKENIKCEKCGHEMSKMPPVPKVSVVKLIAVITNSHEVRKILECLKRNNAPPFD